jgi:hypothetical protein
MKLTNLFRPNSWTKAMYSTFAATLLLINTSSAQSCLVNQVVANSGWDPVTSTVVASGSNCPNWQLTAGTAAFYTASGAVNGPAEVITPWSGWTATDPNSAWISYDASGVAGYATPAGSLYEMELTYTFTTCLDDKITFDMSFARDNYIADVLIDGVGGLVFSETPNDIATNYTTFATGSATVLLTAGTHTITVVSGNAVWDDHGYIPTHGHGLNILCTITGQINSIVGPACERGYKCPPVTCNDPCYWKVEGNNILLNNIFGTLSNDDVRVQTNGTDRGILDKTGLFGWNTMNPTAYLHVNCTGHNGPPTNALSDVRFERLETGKGNVLVIGVGGYVYNSGINLDDLIHGASQGKSAGNEDLQQEVEALKQQVQALMNEKRQSGGVMNNPDNILYQNNPNPFSNETEIGYEIKNMRTKAAINIYDLNGKQLKSYPINATGKGKITVNKESLTSGVYMYSLIVDGVENATKRMVLTN